MALSEQTRLNPSISDPESGWVEALFLWDGQPGELQRAGVK